jgi:hypothetical protein
MRTKHEDTKYTKGHEELLILATNELGAAFGPQPKGVDE